MTGTHINFKQKLAINNKLLEVCAVINGFAQYKQGWSDTTVAEYITASNPDKTATIINCNHVAGVRKSIFGPQKTGREGVKNITTRVAEIEKFLNTNFDYMS